MIRGFVSNLFAVVGVGAIALLCGYMVGASGTPVVATALPLVFGLVTVVVGLLALWKKEDNSNLEQTAKRVASAKMLSGAAALVFAVCFGAGVLTGQFHKRQYAMLDMDHLISEKQPTTYEGALQWFSLLSSLERYQASDDVKDFFYDALLQHEAKMTDASKATADLQTVLSLVAVQQAELEKRVAQLEKTNQDGSVVDQRKEESKTEDDEKVENPELGMGRNGGGAMPLEPVPGYNGTMVPYFCDPDSPLRSEMRRYYSMLGYDYPCPDEPEKDEPVFILPNTSPRPWPEVNPEGPWSPLDKRPFEGFLKYYDLQDMAE